jgi:hypothetical protein
MGRWFVMPRVALGAAITLAVTLSPVGPAHAATGDITTFAGTGVRGYSGDAGPATSAQIGFTSGLDVGQDGTLYIADATNNRVRVVAPSGVITTVAGTGTAGNAGDGGPATSALLRNPTDVAVDPSGAYYIADEMNHVVRKVDGQGNISTVAGTGTAGFSGDGGAATSAALNLPIDVALDAAGNLYIADSGNSRVRKVNASSHVITTVAGTGVAGFSGDGGAATGAQLNQPAGVTVDANGALLVGDTQNNRIRRVDTSGTITTVAGNGTYGYGGDGGAATSAALGHPNRVAVDSAGNLFVADPSNQRIREVAGGTINTIAGSGTSGFSGDGGAATSASLSNPNAVALDADGNLYISDSLNYRIRRVDAIGSVPTPQGFVLTSALGVNCYADLTMNGTAIYAPPPAAPTLEKVLASLTASVSCQGITSMEMLNISAELWHEGQTVDTLTAHCVGPMPRCRSLAATTGASSYSCIGIACAGVWNAKADVTLVLPPGDSWSQPTLVGDTYYCAVFTYPNWGGPGVPAQGLDCHLFTPPQIISPLD